MSSAGPKSAKRFLQHCDRYIECVSREAELREHGEVLDLEAFIPLRRENSAVRLCFGLFEYVLGLDLPQEVFDDATFMEAYWAAADMICWANVSWLADLIHLPRTYRCVAGRLLIRYGTVQGYQWQQRRHCTHGGQEHRHPNCLRHCWHVL